MDDDPKNFILLAIVAILFVAMVLILYFQGGLV